MGKQVEYSNGYFFPQGKGRFMPYNRDTHSKSFGGPRDYYNCTGRFYIITHKPTKVDVTSVKTSKPITLFKSHNLRDS